ncbi:MAG: signal peptidase I [Pseudomonadota bacterium]
MKKSTRSGATKDGELVTAPEIAQERSSRAIFQEYSEAFVVAVVLAIIIRAFLIQAFKIPSGSMIPTLLVGDHILVNKFIYGIRIPFTNIRWLAFSDPKRGDVIVFVYPEDRTKDFIKRVVAVSGDTVEIKNKKLLINSAPVEEPFTQYDQPVLPRNSIVGERDNYGPTTVPKNRLFVMGDNRDHSQDSRFWGFVPVEDVKGEAFMIYYSVDNFPLVRWGRIFKLIR